MDASFHKQKWSRRDLYARFDDDTRTFDVGFGDIHQWRQVSSHEQSGPPMVRSFAAKGNSPGY